VSPNEYAADLTNLFPAVDAKSSTWITYASVYLRWFEYAGLAVSTGVTWDVAPEGSLALANSWEVAYCGESRAVGPSTQQDHPSRLCGG